MDARIKTPFIMQVAAPSQSGKTHFVCRLLEYREDLFENSFEQIKWFTPHENIPMSNTKGIKVINALPWETETALASDEEKGDTEEEKENEESKGSEKLYIIDDFALELLNSKELTNFFIKNSHHENTSLILITQALFFPGAMSRVRSINTHYIALMRQTRDQRQIRTLARQITIGNAQFQGFMEAYNAATDGRMFSYLLVSLHPRDNPQLMLRSHIFPEEASSPYVYLLPKTSINR